MEDNAEECRVRIYHDVKPPEGTIAKLRTYGFHWTPSLVLLDTRAAQAEQRSAELEGRLRDALAAKPVPIVKRPLSAPTNTQNLTAEKMAKMKPLLEAGMPIKGAVVLLVDGKPVQRPVEFVMGKETRIESVDDGIQPHEISREVHLGPIAQITEMRVTPWSRNTAFEALRSSTNRLRNRWRVDCASPRAGLSVIWRPTTPLNPAEEPVPKLCH